MLQSPHLALGPTYRITPLRGVAICLVAVGLCTTVPFVPDAGLYAIVVTLLFCVVAPAWFEWQHGRLDFFEPIHLIGLMYFVYFGLGALWTVGDPYAVAYDYFIVPYIPRAALYALLGYLALLVGYYLPWQQRALPKTVIERPRGTVFLLICSAVGFAGMMAGVVLERASVYRVPIPIEGVVRPLSQLGPLFLFVWGLLWLLVFTGKATRPQRFILLAVVVPGVLLIAYYTFSNKSTLVTLAGIPMAAMWYGRRKLPWKSVILLLFLTIFVVFPFYNTYRNTNRFLDQKKRIGQTYEMIRAWNADDYRLASYGLFKRRMALINSIAVVVRDVGRWVPYARGETIFMPAVGYFIPRALWTDKPPLDGRKFGELFRVVNVMDRETYIAATVPGELYWNFDVPGIIIGMGLLGYGVRFVYRRYVEGGIIDPIRCALYIVVATQLAGLDGVLAANLVYVVRTLIVLEVLLWMARYYGLLESREVAARA